MKRILEKQRNTKKNHRGLFPQVKGRIHPMGNHTSRVSLFQPNSTSSRLFKLFFFFNCKSNETFKKILKTNSQIIPRPWHPQLLSCLHFFLLSMCGLPFPLVMGNILHEKQKSAPQTLRCFPLIFPALFSYLALFINKLRTSLPLDTNWFWVLLFC